MLIKNSSGKKKVEVLEGVIYHFDPQTKQHENIVTELTKQFSNEMSTLNTHEVYSAPFGFSFIDDKGNKNFIIPDLMVFEKDNDISPSFVLNILYEDDDHELFDKKIFLYKEQGIKEYWILYPEIPVLIKHVLNQNFEYEETAYMFSCGDSKVEIGILKGLFVDFGLVFPEIRKIDNYHFSNAILGCDAPECISMVNPNTKEAEIKKLKDVYGAEPASLDDVILLVLADKVKQRQKEYPNIEVLPILFASRELDIKSWKFLMSAVDNNSMYIQKINMILRKLRERLTLSTLKKEIESSKISKSQKEYALNRLNIAKQFIDDTVSMKKLLRPGRMIIVDLRDEFIEKEQALGLFVVMLNIFAGVETYEGEKFNKLIVFDEAHKYMGHSELTKHVVGTIRQMRHQGVNLLIASQDPPSLPNEIIELSSVAILHRFNSP